MQTYLRRGYAAKFAHNGARLSSKLDLPARYSPQFTVGIAARE